jgi:hypothetical protein
MSRQNGDKPKFIEFITPVGRVVYESLAEPQQDEDNGVKKVDPETGAPIMYYKATLMWPKTEMDTSLIDLRTKAAQARDLKWAPGSYDPQWFALEPFLRDGDNPLHNTKAREELKGHVYLTFKSKATMARDAQGKWYVQKGQPGVIGPANEELLAVDVYSGCFARVSGIMFGTEYSGKKFISVRLNNVQKARDGERLAAGRPDAKSQFDPLSNVPLGGAAAPAGGGPLPSML